MVLLVGLLRGLSVRLLGRGLRVLPLIVGRRRRVILIIGARCGLWVLRGSLSGI